MNTPRGIELNITSLLRAGENLVALRVAGESGQVAENYPGAGEVILYTRPETHLADLEVNSTLDGSVGLVDLNLTVENRMDSVRERLLGVIHEPLYSSIDMKGQLNDE